MSAIARALIYPLRLEPLFLISRSDSRRQTPRANGRKKAHKAHNRNQKELAAKERKEHIAGA